MKFKVFMILLAIVGLIAVSLFVGYFIGLSQPKKAPVNPLFFSDAGKQVALLSEKINTEKEKASATGEGAEKKAEEKAEKQKKDIPETPKKEAPKKEGESKKKEEKPEEKPEEKKELELPTVEDPKALGKKLRYFYQTGHLDQKKKKEQLVNQKRLKLFYMRTHDADEKRLESRNLWTQGDRSHGALKKNEDLQYTSLEKLNEPFSLKHVHQAFDFPKNPTKKQYAEALNKIIIDPWYSRVHY